MIQTKSEDAVSPVIGVMLMLVVTIIIAAVVAAFAGGVGADAEPAPVTVLNVEGASAGHIETVPGKMEIIGGATAFRGFSKYYTDENGNEISSLGQFNPETKYVMLYKDDKTKPFGRIVITEYNENNGRPIIDAVNGQIESIGDDWQDYLEMGDPTEKEISKNTVTISCLHGDSLDLSKASVKVYNPSGNLIHEQKLSDSSKTFGPGDTITVILNTESLEFTKGKSVEIEVLYGEHILVSKELTVTREW